MTTIRYAAPQHIATALLRPLDRRRAERKTAATERARGGGSVGREPTDSITAERKAASAELRRLREFASGAEVCR